MSVLLAACMFLWSLNAHVCSVTDSQYSCMPSSICNEFGPANTTNFTWVFGILGRSMWYGKPRPWHTKQKAVVYMASCASAIRDTRYQGKMCSELWPSWACRYAECRLLYLKWQILLELAAVLPTTPRVYMQSIMSKALYTLQSSVQPAAVYLETGGKLHTF